MVWPSTCTTPESGTRRAIRKHPDWAVINADGSTNVNATSFFSPYADQLLIPQLRELAGDYGVDGAWVDGECWASQPDYGDAARKAFQQATGFAGLPRKPGESHWLRVPAVQPRRLPELPPPLHRRSQKTNPDMQLCSNWAFTDHMPEAVSAPVDWISGDYSPEDSVNSARFFGALSGASRQALGFDGVGIRHQTRQRRIESEVRRSIAARGGGGAGAGRGFQAYFNQRRDGSVPRNTCR